MKEKIFDYEDRLVRFAAECILFSAAIKKDDAGNNYAGQLIRSSGGSAVNFGEAKGTQTDKDFVHNTSTSLKELKESRINLKILTYSKYGDHKMRNWLQGECNELILIGSKMILNKKAKS